MGKSAMAFFLHGRKGNACLMEVSIMKKKIVIGILALVVISSLFGGKGKKNSQSTVDQAAVETQTEEIEAASEEVTTEKSTEESSEKSTEKSEKKEKDKKSKADNIKASGVTPEFKEFMDSYEAFFDEYVDFMKEFNDSEDTIGMLAEYSDYMSRYADAMEKMEDIDDDDLSTEDYAYYIDVMSRVQKKLLEISE